MSADFARTLGAITPEYAEAAGGEVEAVGCCEHSIRWHHEERGCGYHGYAPEHRCPCLLTYDEAVVHLLATTRQAAADAVLAEARAMCCDADTSPHHAARAEHARVMGIAERLARAVRDA
jgi:hypothetical protein